MSVPIAYLGVIVIWSTTPLAAQWSTGSFTPLAAAALRLLLATLVVYSVAFALRAPALQMRRQWRLYAAGSLALFPNLALINGAAQYLPSGLISVIFGLSPFVIVCLAGLRTDKVRPGARHYGALLIALVGLGVVSAERVQIDGRAWLGVLMMLMSVAVFSISSVWVSQLAGSTAALCQLRGSLLMALPGVLLSWWLLDGDIPQGATLRSTSAVVYLAVAGSLLGVWAHLYLLATVSVGAVSVIPLITPVFALLIGALLNAEPLSLSMLVGAALITLGLVLFRCVQEG